MRIDRTDDHLIVNLMPRFVQGCGDVKKAMFFKFDESLEVDGYMEVEMKRVPDRDAVLVSSKYTEGCS
jgi:hypothetical protein